MSILNLLFKKKNKIQPIQDISIKNTMVNTSVLEAPKTKEELIKTISEQNNPTIITTQKEEKGGLNVEQMQTKLKKEVQEIINLYKEKEKTTINNINQTSISYEIKSNPQTKQKNEEVASSNIPTEISNEKDIIFKEINEVQKRIKTLKERTEEIEKEKIELAKKEKELYSELTEEERTIQKLRDLDLPKEYLKLLEKLDKITINESPTVIKI